MVYVSVRSLELSGFVQRQMKCVLFRESGLKIYEAIASVNTPKQTFFRL